MTVRADKVTLVQFLKDLLPGPGGVDVEGLASSTVIPLHYIVGVAVTAVLTGEQFFNSVKDSSSLLLTQSALIGIALPAPKLSRCWGSFLAAWAQWFRNGEPTLSQRRHA